MTPTDRRARERAETQRKILDAARRLFAVEGYEAVTMRRISDACEYTPAALYNHFPDKAALLRQLCRLDFLALAERFSQVAAITDPLDRLAATGMEYVRFGLEHPNHYRMMFLAPPPLPKAARHTRSPSFTIPFSHASQSAMGTDAAVVLPYF